MLIISPYREKSGWGEHGRRVIQALDSVGVDVVCRPLVHTNPHIDLPEAVKRCEQKSTKDCNIVIQNVLPHLMDYNGHFDKNIGLYTTESLDIKYTPWVSKLNTMDELWCTNNDIKNNAKESGITVPHHVVYEPCDPEVYQKKHEPIHFDQNIDEFKFYFIGEYNRRKHIAALIKAYYLEFTPNEPASLIIKVNKQGWSSDELHKEMVGLSHKVAENLKIRSLDQYRPITILTDYVKPEDIARIHTTCDCFVTASFGEGWCLPAFDAMAYGNRLIGSGVGGLKEMAVHGSGNVSLVDGRYEPIFGMNETFEELNTGREQWFNVDVHHLRECMRAAYEGFKWERPMTPEELKPFSFETVGQQIKELLLS